MAARERKHFISSLFQLEYNIQKDEVLSRVPRKSLLYGLLLDYAYNTGSILFRVELAANAGTIRSFTNTTKGLEITGFFAFTNLYRLRIKTERFKLWLGAKLKFDMDAIPSDDDDALRYGWDVTLFANPTLAFDYVISPQLTMSYETDFNLLGIMWRPQAQGFTLRTEEILETQGMVAVLFENPRFASLHNIFQWNNIVGLDYHITELLTLRTGLGLNYARIDVPRVKKRLTPMLRVGMKFRF